MVASKELFFLAKCQTCLSWRGNTFSLSQLKLVPIKPTIKWIGFGANAFGLLETPKVFNTKHLFKKPFFMCTQTKVSCWSQEPYSTFELHIYPLNESFSVYTDESKTNKGMKAVVICLNILVPVPLLKFSFNFTVTLHFFFPHFDHSQCSWILNVNFKYHKIWNHYSLIKKFQMLHVYYVNQKIDESFWVSSDMEIIKKNYK